MHLNKIYNNIINKNKNIILIESLVINSVLIPNENFHRIQKRFIKIVLTGLTIESKKVKDNLLFKFEDKTIFNQYITTKNTFTKNQVNVGYLKDYYELYDKMYKNIANNFGVKDISFKYSKYYKSHIKNLYIGFKHPIFYITISEGEYVTVVFTNLTSKNKEIIINYLNKTKVLKFEEVGIHSPTGKQYLCTTTIWVKIHKDDLNEFIDSNINLVNLGGQEHVDEIKEAAYNIMIDSSTQRIYEELHVVHALNRVAEESENQNKILYRFYNKNNSNLIDKIKIDEE